MTYWPWPLSAVQPWFEGIFDSVGTWITDGLTGLWDDLTASFSAVSGWITAGLDTLWANIVANFSSVSKWVTDGLGWVWNGIVSSFTSLFEWLTDCWEWLWTKVSAAVAGAVKWITDSASWIWSQVSQGLTWLWNTVTGALGSLASSLGAFFSDLWSKTSGAVSGAITAIGNGLTWAVGTIAGYVQDALAGVASAVTSGAQGVLEWLWSGLTWIAEKVVGAISAVRAAVEPTFQGIITSVTGAVSQAFSPHTLPEDIQKASEDLAKNLQLGIQKIVTQGEHSLPSYEEVQASALRTTVMFCGAALISSVTGIVVDLVHPVKGLGVQDALVNIVKTVSESAVTSPIITIPLEASTYRPMHYYANAMYPTMVPGAGDLIRFVVREVINLDIFYQNMLYMGYDHFWGEAFWEAHFVLPGLGILVDAYHKGVITSEELNTYVFWHDYKPEKRPGISKSDIEIIRSSYKTLIPRVDLRYAWEAGVLTDEELVERYRRMGFEDDSETMADIQMGRAMVEEITKIRTEWLTDFTDGYITEETLRANLAAIGTGPARVDYYALYAVKRRSRENMKDLLANYKAGYLKDLVTDEDLAARVGEILVDPQAVENFIQSAYVAKYLKPKAPTAAAIKVASLAYLTTAFRGGLITEAQLRGELLERLYPQADVDTIVSVETMKKKKAAGA